MAILNTLVACDPPVAAEVATAHGKANSTARQTQQKAPVLYLAVETDGMTRVFCVTCLHIVDTGFQARSNAHSRAAIRQSKTFSETAVLRGISFVPARTKSPDGCQNNSLGYHLPLGTIWLFSGPRNINETNVHGAGITQKERLLKHPIPRPGSISVLVSQALNLQDNLRCSVDQLHLLGIPLLLQNDGDAKELKVMARETGISDFQAQQRKLSLARSKEDMRQVFDEMPHRHVVSWRRLFYFSAQNDFSVQLLRNGWEMKELEAAEPVLCSAEKEAMDFREVSYLCNPFLAINSVGGHMKKLQKQAQLEPSVSSACTRFRSSQLHRGKQESDTPVSFQIVMVLLSGKSLLQWVSSSDLVQDLKQILEFKLGISSASQRLLYEGKQLEDSNPLSFYNIRRNASIIFSLRLRGGAGGQSSSAAAPSYKDVVHAQMPKKTTPPAQAPKPFLVDRLEESPSIEIKHPLMDSQFQMFAETAIICKFNGLWPCTADLFQWIHSNWTKNCKVLLCSKGFFMVLFACNADYQKALTEGPWFWDSAGLFLTPWFPDFDPSTAVITKLPIWVRLPNLPAHLWHSVVFQAIGNSLGRYLDVDASRGEKSIYTFARICAEIDISKGLPEQVILKMGDFHWTQTLDFENTAFRCRNCHLTGHLQNSCPSMPAKNKKVSSKPKSKSWKPHAPPPLGVFDSSSDEEIEEEVEEDMDATLAQDPTSTVLEVPKIPPILQKRTHVSSPSDSDKESSPSAQLSLQIVAAQQSNPGWVKVGKKKGKKGRTIASTTGE